MNKYLVQDFKKKIIVFIIIILFILLGIQTDAAGNEVSNGVKVLNSSIKTPLFNALEHPYGELSEPAQLLFNALVSQDTVVELTDYKIPLDDFINYWNEAISFDPLVYEANYKPTYTRVYSSQNLILRIKIKYSDLNNSAFLKRYTDMQSSIQEYISNASHYVNIYEKILSVHDKMAFDIAYEKQSGEKYSTESYMAYGALVNHIAVCDGYTYAFNLIMRYLGIDSIRVANESNTHSWNAVEINGHWYYVDVTLDDPFIAGEDREGVYRYTNFLRTEAELRKNSEIYSGTFVYEGPAIQANDTTFSKMPVGTNSVQTYENGYWYLISNDKNSILKTDFYGNILSSVVKVENGNISSIAIHNNTLYYTNLRTLLKYDLSKENNVAMAYTPNEYLLCYKIYPTSSKLVLYYMNSDTDFVKESYDYTKVLQTGFIVDSNKKVYYRYSDGTLAKGLNKIGKETYYFDSYGCMVYGYKKISGKRYYFNPETGAAQYGVIDAGSYTFDFMEDGEVAKGLTNVNGKLYYFDETDGNAKAGLRTLDGNKYYFDPETFEAVSGFKEVGNYTYYFRPNTYVSAIGLVVIDENTYYFGPDGIQCHGYKTIDGRKYYFDLISGQALYGIYTVSNGNTYYFAENGEVLKGLQEEDGKIYYFGSTYGIALTGWRIYDGNTYYFDSVTCAAKTGEQVIDDQTYTFSEKGVLLK